MMWNGACPLWNNGNIGNFGTWGWIWMALNLLVWVGLIAGLVYLAVWVVRRRSYSLPAAASSGPVSAREIAQLRYARGEIGRDEYLKLIEDLH